MKIFNFYKYLSIFSKIHLLAFWVFILNIIKIFIRLELILENLNYVENHLNTF